jgi:hypothetical protein
LASIPGVFITPYLHRIQAPTLRFYCHLYCKNCRVFGLLSTQKTAIEKSTNGKRARWMSIRRTRFDSNHAWARAKPGPGRRCRRLPQPAQFLQSKTQETRSTKPILTLLKQIKGDNYGIPDPSWRRRDDGALRSYYRGLFETA